MMRPVRFVTVVVFAAVLPIAVRGAELHGEVPNPYEDAAVEKGRQLGIGSMGLEGPGSVEVLSHQTFTLQYTAGRAGIRPGGGLRIGLRHLSNWSAPQRADPKAEGYMTIEAPEGQPVRATVDFRNKYFAEYFAWHNMIEVVLPDRGMKPGETLRMTLGDTSGGSPGMRVQPFDETCFVFKTFVDALGEGKYLPLGDSPAIEIVAAEPVRLSVVMPSDAVIGQPTWCLVRAEDRYGNPAPRYRGSIGLTSTDPKSVLPKGHEFTGDDGGVYRFEPLVMGSGGVQTVSVSDGQWSAVSNPVRAGKEKPEELLLWGDLHGHTLFSDGRGTVEEYYDFAENVAGLDFCAVSDHAFELVDAMWEHTKKVTNRANRPGRFVTFQAYEWSGNTPLGGDHNCYFLDDDPPLHRSTNYYCPDNLQMGHDPAPKLERVSDVLAALSKHLTDKNVICIPHFGGRKGNPEYHDPKVQRLIEIFSEHRRSEDWATTFLARGYRLGIMASSDGHFGNPGHGYLRPTYDWEQQEIGMAAVAVRAKEHTRESIFRALYDRHVYATSGDRIVLDFTANGQPMGSELQGTSAPLLEVEAVGTAAIARIEIKKNSAVVHTIEPRAVQAAIEWRDPDFDPARACYYYVRIEQENGEEAISSPIWLN
ncbi:MAG: DUF3604 domain-containing protein [Planctomycetaceae bacterium]|nr:DUF3604 domain-containing protein [Planctomycetaceae bacterium]